MQERIERYFTTLGRMPFDAVTTAKAGKPLATTDAFTRAIELARGAHARGNKLMFIGNGGSAAIASHMAIDYTKNGNMRSLAFNDGSSLTCLGNDLGYENVFAKQIEMHARAGDLLIAISSSGKSPNILRGVEAARRMECDIITLSGFGADNPLRELGDINFYVPAGEYGFVEITHLSLCHAVLDLALGWGADAVASASAAE
jgi:D-sedoheptulose 7-phosphate isomerase